MRFLRGLYAAWLYGLALGRFLGGRHEDAVRLFTRVLDLKGGENSAFTHAHLGYCHLALGDDRRALEHLNNAYIAFEASPPENPEGSEGYVEYLDVFSRALLQAGETARAREIQQEAARYRALHWPL